MNSAAKYFTYILYTTVLGKFMDYDLNTNQIILRSNNRNMLY